MRIKKVLSFAVHPIDYEAMKDAAHEEKLNFSQFVVMIFNEYKKNKAKEQVK